MKKILFILIIPVQLCLINLSLVGQTQNCYTQQLPQGITGISLSTAHQMASLYNEKQANYIRKQAINFADTRSVWFSLDKLKSFIAEIENKVCSSQCNTGNLDLGVRFYFGDYPDADYMTNNGNEDYATVKSTYGKHQTIFLVPTYRDQDRGAQVDFDPRDMGDLAKLQCKPKPLKITEPVNLGDNDPGSTNRVRGSVPPGSITPGTRKLLILSTTEPQYFISQFKKNAGKNAKGGTQTPNSPNTITNHGNSIPPDSKDGTAF
jgi:hypothetical protein